MREEVILVDEHDQQVGVEEKQKAHEEGKLHRAFSLFIFNEQGQLLLQKRAAEKYHSGGLWSNSCCSHPKPGETLEQATHRRLVEEMGFDCELTKAFQFTYKATLANGLVEHEVDHVYLGLFSGQPQLNPLEAERCEWVELKALESNLSQYPERYTYWLAESFDRLVAHLQLNPLPAGASRQRLAAR